MTRLPILLLAAGASSRMRGADKLLQEVSGRALLTERAISARATGERVYVTLPPEAAAPARWAAIEGTGVHPVAVADRAEGMAASLRAGLAALPDEARGVLLLLADMPEITSGDMLSLLSRFDGETILRGATTEGRPGHPVLFPRRDFPALTDISGDRGARDVLQREAARVRAVPLPGHHALIDLDTPEDWATWRSR